MKKINLNELAMDITSGEKQLEQVNIAQIKEILRVLFTTHSLEDIILIWFKYHK